VKPVQEESEMEGGRRKEPKTAKTVIIEESLVRFANWAERFRT
jgi:hypothetical protein